MGYPGGSLSALVTDRNTWQSRANSAWGSTRVWNSGTSFESAYNAEVTLYNTEFANARDTSAGTHPTGWASGQLWSTTSSQWQTQYNAEVTLYNNEVTAYNNLLNGLNSPDGLTSVAISASYTGTGSQTGATATLTIPRTGHYLIAIDCRHTITMTSGTTGFIQNNLSGLAAETYVINLTASSGTQTPCYSKVIHGDFTAGQTLSLNFTAFRGDGSATGAIYAHFVPNATNHN